MNSNHTPPRAISVCIAMMVAPVTGCGHDPAAVAIAEISIEAPAEFQDQGRPWVRTDLRPADQDCLARFFQLNQQLVGSPEMEGTPVVFSSGKNDRRFYWLTAATDGSLWTCVHYEKGRFSISDGAGNPFLGAG